MMIRKTQIAFQLTKGMIILSSIYFLGVYLLVALERIGYPYELEWMEGAMVDACRWILKGNPLYGPPKLTFTPFVYPPLYFWLSGALMKLIGVGFLAPRLISLAASLGTFALVFSLVRRETGSILGGLLASGLLAAAYPVTGAWLDIARVDSLFLFWLTLGIFRARMGKAVGGAVVTALIFSAAFYTKQVSLLPALAVGSYYLVEDRRRFLPYFLTLLVAVGGGSFCLNRCYNGWYFYYIFKLSALHDISWGQIRDFWLKDVLLTFPVAALAVLWLGIGMINELGLSGKSSRGWFYLLIGGSLLIVSLIGRANVNSYVNTLLPAAVAFSIFFGWGGAIFLKGEVGGGRIFRWGVPGAVLILAQFLLLFYSPSDQVPGRADRLAGDKFVGFLRQVPGRVFVPFHGYLPYLAGKETSAHWTAVLDVLLARGKLPDDPARNWLDEFRRNLNEGTFSILILDRENWFPELIRAGYEKSGVIFKDSRVFYPVTGYAWRPQYVYRRRSELILPSTEIKGPLL